MAKLRVMSAFDGKLGVFNPPQYFQHLGQALRAWEEVCNNPQSMMCKHPADFVLYEIGTFDEDKGVFSNHSPHMLVQSALEAVRKPQESLPMRGLEAVANGQA